MPWTSNHRGVLDRAVTFTQLLSRGNTLIQQGILLYYAQTISDYERVIAQLVGEMKYTEAINLLHNALLENGATLTTIRLNYMWLAAPGHIVCLILLIKLTLSVTCVLCNVWYLLVNSWELDIQVVASPDSIEAIANCRHARCQTEIEGSSCVASSASVLRHVRQSERTAIESKAKCRVIKLISCSSVKSCGNW